MSDATMDEHEVIGETPPANTESDGSQILADSQQAPQDTTKRAVVDRIMRMLSSDAIVLALATLLGYLVVYVYNLGAFASVGLPSDLIPLDLAGVFAAASGIFFAGFAGVFNFFANFVSLAWADDRVFYAIRNSLIWVTFVLIALTRVLSLNGLALVLLGVLIGYTVFIRRKMKAGVDPDKARLPEHHPLDVAANIIHEWGGKRALSATLTFVYALLVIFVTGEWNGPVRGPVWVSGGSTRYVMLRSSGDVIFAVPLHDSKNFDTSCGCDIEIDSTIKFFRQGDPSTPAFTRVSGSVTIWRPTPTSTWARIAQFMLNSG